MPRVFDCKRCNSTFSDRQSLNNHILEEHLQQHEYSCPRCEFKTTNPHAYEDHNASHKRAAEEPYDVLTQKQRCVAFKNRQYQMNWKYRQAGPTDLLQCFKNYRQKLQRRLAWYFKKEGLLKYYWTIKVTFIKGQDDSLEFFQHHFHSKMKRLLRVEDFEDLYEESCNYIWEQFDQFLALGSGARLHSIDVVQINIFKYQPIDGTSWIETPIAIQSKTMYYYYYTFYSYLHFR